MVYCFEYCSFFFLDDCCLDIETFEKRFFLAARFAAVLVGWGKGQEYEGCAPFAFQPLLFFAKSCYSSSSNSPPTDRTAGLSWTFRCRCAWADQPLGYISINTLARVEA